MTPTVGELREVLFTILEPMPGVTVYQWEPDGTALPAMWIDQPAAYRSEAARTLSTVLWSVIVAVDPTTGAGAGEALDVWVDAITETVAATDARFRLNGWTRDQRDVGGVQSPAVSVQFESDHNTKC